MPGSNPGAYKVTRSSSTGKRSKLKKPTSPKKVIEPSNAASIKAKTTTDLERRLKARRRKAKQ